MPGPFECVYVLAEKSRFLAFNQSPLWGGLSGDLDDRIIGNSGRTFYKGRVDMFSTYSILSRSDENFSVESMP
jgi:hypothetical protein